MIKHDKKINFLFTNWLIICFFLVLNIIIVGGFTRLTNSGLSITEWELFKGIFPPLNSESWNNYFDLYKKIPQYELINYNMSLEQFKIIFFWEYFHRFLGRVIGLFFFIPLIFFHFSKKIDIKFIYSCYFIFFLILLQGVVGWYMVKSGLVDDVTVSHYRLSVHLTIALIIISYIFWVFLNFKKNTSLKFFNISKKNILFFILVLIIFLQIILGAFVSGLDAGSIYQTWPLMGETFIPGDFVYKNFNSVIDFNNHSLIQFYHRNLAYFISLYILILGLYIFINKIKKLYKPFLIIFLFLFFQVILGIFTLLSGLNIYIASAHQFFGVLLVLSTINLYYSKMK